MIIPHSRKDIKKMIEDMVDRGMDESCKRAQELKKIVESLDIIKWPAIISSAFYDHSARSYVFGLDIATIMAGSAASESFLRYILKEKKDLKFWELIKNAKEQHLISEDLAKRLHHLRKYVRNVVFHGHDELATGYVGMKRVDTHRWEAEGGKYALPFRNAALYVMETYALLVKETETSWSPSS